MAELTNVIITENLYDQGFVAEHVYGWEQFVERVNQYPLDKVAEITWVPRDKIEQAARLFATTRPAAIQWGVAIEQQINCADNNRALMALMGITGNIDVKGGQVLFNPPKIRNVGNFGAYRLLPHQQATAFDWPAILPSSIPSASGMRLSRKNRIP